ncbi:MAG TPA: hypothetical protein VGV87_03910 [Blastocatellia bacterium]|jgi:hypothetical protein|nr:hypothetical protein [Blastocatellia bacterium]
MAKSDLFEQAQAAGLVASDASADDYTVAQLEALLAGDVPAWEGSLSDKPFMPAPDGHDVMKNALEGK